MFVASYSGIRVQHCKVEHRSWQAMKVEEEGVEGIAAEAKKGYQRY